MPYDVKITDIETRGTYETQIEELKEIREILNRYKDKTIELELHKVKIKRKGDL